MPSRRAWLIGGVLLLIVGTGLLWRGDDTPAPRARPAAHAVPVVPACATAASPFVEASIDDDTIRRVLDRVGYGPRPGDVDRVRRLGLPSYLSRQLDPGAVQDVDLERRLGAFHTRHLTTAQLAVQYYQPAVRARRSDQLRPLAGADASPATAETEQAFLGFEELRREKILRAVYSERQLQEVLVDFWFNHFNVAAWKGPVWLYLPEYERDAIRPHVLGRFRDMLGAVARSPAMLFYLDNWLSSDPEGQDPVTVAQDRRLGRAARMVRSVLTLIGAAGGRSAGDASRRLERAIYDRERQPGLNENYARELLELHTLGVDGGYTQRDVRAVAGAFTGWTLDDPWERGGGFIFEPRIHQGGDKTVLGTSIPDGGLDEGEAILDLLADHPSTARMIATKLARRFVGDDPPAPLVDRAARCFLESGGRLRQVVRVIVMSPELLDAAVRRTKVKTPLEFVASALRAVGAEVSDADAVAWQLQALGMPLYEAQPPTGYPDEEHAWVNAGALVNRMDFALALAHDAAAGVEVPDPSGAVLGLATTEATPDQVALRLASPEFQRR